MNKLTEKNCEKFGLEWEDLIHCEPVEEITSPGKHDCTWVEMIIEINKEDFPNADESVLGFWQAEAFERSYTDGSYLEQISFLVRVAQKEVVVKRWAPVQ